MSDSTLRPLASAVKQTVKSALNEFSYYSTYAVSNPTQITFDITDRCQLKCSTCSKWTTPADMAKQELSLEEWKTTILKLKDWLGSYSFIFSGGEPFLRKDIIFELIDFADQNGVKVSVISNGYSIENLAEQIVQSKLSSLTISLNGITPEVHDKSRGIKGSFERTTRSILKLNALRKAHGNRLRLALSTILMEANSQDIIPLLEWVEEQGLNGISFQMLEDSESFHPYAKVQSLNTDDYQAPKQLSTLRVETQKGIELIDKLIEKKRQGAPIQNSEAQLKAFEIVLRNPVDILEVKCRVGITSLAIDPYGNVRLCYNMQPIGSIKEIEPKVLWNFQGAKEQRCEIKNCKMSCRLLNCNF